MVGINCIPAKYFSHTTGLFVAQLLLGFGSKQTLTPSPAAMTSVADAPPDLNSHLFRNTAPPVLEQPTVAPADVALSPQEYPTQDLAQAAQQTVAQHEHVDKDLNPQVSPLSGRDSSATAIQMLEGDVTDQVGVTQGEEVGSSDDSAEWTEGESQEHKRVKVRSPSLKAGALSSYLYNPFSGTNSHLGQGLRTRWLALGGSGHSILLWKL